MKKVITMVTALLLTMIPLLSLAADGEVSFSGTIKAKEEISVLADKKGKVSTIGVKAGESIKTGTRVVSLATDKIYSPADGKVTLVCCEKGDSSSAVIDRYGALMYVEDQYSYEVVATVDSAFNTADNKLIHSGETVYLHCNDGKHTGEGVISKIDGNEYHVLVTAGKLLIGETINVYRLGGAKQTAEEAESQEGEESNPTDESEIFREEGIDVDKSNRIGRGMVKRINPYSITGNGNIVKLHVSEGDDVFRGDVLCEIIDSGISGYSEEPDSISAPVSGIVGSINVSPGDEINKNDVIAVIYPSDEIVVRGYVSEFEIPSLSIDEEVEIEMLSGDGRSRYYPGKITNISMTSDKSGNEGGDGAVSYEVTVEFETTDKLYYGMSVIVNIRR